MGLQRYRFTQFNARLACLFVILGYVLGSTGALSQSDPQTHDIVVAANYPPLMVAGDPDRPGFAVEVLRAATERAGRTFDLQFLPFQRALYQTRTTTNTLMPALFRNESREENFRWIAHIHSAQLRFLTLGDAVNTLDQAQELGIIGVEEGSTGDRFLASLGVENVARIKSPSLSAQMLDAGRIETWLLTLPLAKATWRQLGFTKELVAGDVIFELPVYLVSGLDLPDETAEAYVQAIKAMDEDGTLAQLRAKYLD